MRAIALVVTQRASSLLHYMLGPLSPTMWRQAGNNSGCLHLDHRGKVRFGGSSRNVLGFCVWIRTGHLSLIRALRIYTLA